MLAPAMMPRAAWPMSAVSSTTTGGLPGPAATTFLPEFMATLTTPGPPVTTSRLMPGYFINSWADRIVGLATQHSRLSGPPTSMLARFMMSTVIAEVCLARGWQLNTPVLPPATKPMPLQMMVSVALVVGVMDPITP